MVTCPFCEEQAETGWLILHQPGCPAGEEIESDEDQEDEDDEEVT
jgi:hypothetical protein